MTNPGPTPGVPVLPHRPTDGHKGTFGSLGIVGGCCAAPVLMIGAPALAARAALRSGVGLVRVAAPGPIAAGVLALIPSATALELPTQPDGRVIGHEAAAVIDRLLETSDALVVGPGMGLDEATGAITLRLLGQTERPVVVDADGLNGLAETPEFWKDVRAAAVLTPHPGEFHRLAKGLGIKHDLADTKQRTSAAESLAQRLACVVVLKGKGTVVTDGQKTWVCERGHACLATGGTGDVLSGLIGGLLAQFAPRPGAPTKDRLSLLEIAIAAVDTHARAGELWAERSHTQAGLLATELADRLPEALEPLRTLGAA